MVYLLLLTCGDISVFVTQMYKKKVKVEQVGKPKSNGVQSHFTQPPVTSLENYPSQLCHSFYKFSYMSTSGCNFAVDTWSKLIYLYSTLHKTSLS